MDADDHALLQVLAAADGPLSAREVAARITAQTVEHVIATGLSATVAKKLCSLSTRSNGSLVYKDYPYGQTFCSYGLTEAGKRMTLVAV